MTVGCSECTRLWAQYADATRQHFVLDNKLQLAELNHDQEVIHQLTPGVVASCQRRIAYREEISTHERNKHS